MASVSSTSSSSSVASMSGLITGIDSASIISQLMAVERQPETRLEEKQSALSDQKSSLQKLRTQLQTLRSSARDFSLMSVFSQYSATSSEDTVLTASISGDSPVGGSYVVNVLQLASASSAASSDTIGDTIDPDAVLSDNGMATEITAGTFTVNGTSFTVDPDTQSLNDILTEINNSDAGVTATYDATTDKVSFTNSATGDTSLINFGVYDDSDTESNFLESIHVTQATQSNNSGGSTTLTGTGNLGAIDSAVALDKLSFANGDITAGTFKINGVSITVDPTTDSLGDIVQRINDSDAQVNATYDSANDVIRLTAKTMGSRTISFTEGTSNFLSVTNLTTATQTAGTDAQFTINGGSTQTRNTNEISDAITGVTMKLLDTGDSTIAISSDDDDAVEAVNDFITAYNDTVDMISELTVTDGTLENDYTISGIMDSLRSMVFGSTADATGTYSSLIDLGITTGDSFDADSVSHLELDESTLREALQDGRNAVATVFNNSASTGIADVFTAYLDDTASTSGFLYARCKSGGSIDTQIDDINDQIEEIERRCTQYETRLKKQYAALEQYAATMKTQSSALSVLG